MTPATATAAPQPGPDLLPRARLRWADTARGLCIGLVVLHHLTSKHLDLVAPAGAEPVVEAWAGVSAVLDPLRMPLFFAISGFFAASALDRSWGSGLRPRVATPYYLYAVWLVLHMAVFSVATALPMNRTRDGGELLADLAWASTGVWYLYALAVYFVLARATRRFDVRLVLGGAAAVSAAASLLPIDEVNRLALLENFVFFAAGARLPDLVRRVADLRRPGLLAALAIVFAAAFVTVELLGVPRGPATVLLSLVAVPFALQIAVALAVRPRVGPVLAALGRRTLPVYVLHVPVLALVHHLGFAPPVPAGSLSSPVTDPLVAVVSAAVVAVYPVLLTAVVVVACLAAQRLLERAGLGFLFRLPALPSTPAARSAARVSRTGPAPRGSR